MHCGHNSGPSTALAITADSPLPVSGQSSDCDAIESTLLLTGSPCSVATGLQANTQDQGRTFPAGSSNGGDPAAYQPPATSRSFCSEDSQSEGVPGEGALEREGGLSICIQGLCGGPAQAWRREKS